MRPSEMEIRDFRLSAFDFPHRRQFRDITQTRVGCKWKIGVAGAET